MKIILTEQQKRMVNMLVERNLLKEGEYSYEEIRNLITLINSKEKENADIAAAIIENMEKDDLQNLINILYITEVAIQTVNGHIKSSFTSSFGRIYPSILKEQAYFAITKGIVKCEKLNLVFCPSYSTFSEVYSYYTKVFPNLNFNNIDEKHLRINTLWSKIIAIDFWLKFLSDFLKNEQSKWNTVIISADFVDETKFSTSELEIVQMFEELISISSAMKHITVAYKSVKGDYLSSNMSDYLEYELNLFKNENKLK